MSINAAILTWEVRPIAVLEKLAFGVPGVLLYLQKRAAFGVFAGAVVDLLWGGLFLLAYQKTPRTA